MKAFAFRLETLLHLREIAKDKALSQYGKAVAKRELMEGQLLSKERRLAELQDEIASRRKVVFPGRVSNPIKDLWIPRKMTFIVVIPRCRFPKK